MGKNLICTQVIVLDADFRNLTYARALLLAFAAAMVGLTAAGGCGSSGGGLPAPRSTPVPFAPIKPQTLVVTTDPNLPHWFVLVNGNSVPSPVAQFTPSVLMVNGAGPAGAPNPNSGNSVGVVPMTLVSNPVGQSQPSAVATAVPFAFSGAQVWEALPGTNSGYYFLRSGESFAVNTINNPAGSLMLGYAATEALFDLGSLPGWNTGIYLDQSESPAGDNSCFEQWSYDPGTAQLTNCAGGQLYASGADAAVGSATSAPANQWYPLPNYHFEQVVDQPNSNPSFPPFTTNQQNAYNWIGQQPAINAPDACSVVVGVGANQQTLGFSGVRCEYMNANFNPVQEELNLEKLSYPVPAPSPYFAPADLDAVKSQLDDELTDVQEVQELFSNIQSVLSTVFLENTNVLTKVVADLDVSSSARPLAVPAAIAEGTLYTLLSALGPVTGVVANSLQTVFDTTTASQPQFEQEVGGTVGELAGNLNTRFNYMSDASTLDYNTIVYDWARLSEIGPETQQYGYWGLAWPDTLTAVVVPYMVNGYEIEVMKALLPLTYNLHEVVGQTSAKVEFPGISSSAYPPSYAQYGWDFGSGAVSARGNTNWSGYYNQGFWETGGFGAAFFSYPDATVMQDDLLSLGANPFEVFSGINGWGGGAGTVYYANLSCEGVIVTVFNATANDLWLNYTTVQGEVSGPGHNFGAVFDSDFRYSLGGLKGTAWAELRPYGYATVFFAQDNVTPTNQTGSVSIYDNNYSTTAAVAAFEEGQDGCTADSKTNIHKGATTAGGYSWSGGLKTRGQSSGEPGGVWGTLINGTAGAALQGAPRKRPAYAQPE